MQFKRSLFITLAFGTLAVLALPAPGDGLEGGASVDPAQPAESGGTGAASKPDIGAVATDAQKDTCFDQCNDQEITASFECYEKCLKKAIAGGQDTGAPQEPIQKVGTPVGTLEQRKTCFKKCEPKLIDEGESCYVQCLDEATGGAASAAANAGANGETGAGADAGANASGNGEASGGAASGGAASGGADAGAGGAGGIGGDASGGANAVADGDASAGADGGSGAGLS